MWLDPIQRVLGPLVGGDRNSVQYALSRARLVRGPGALLVSILEAIEDAVPEYALAEWPTYRGEPGLDACRRAVAKWLEQAPDPEDYEWFDSRGGSAQRAETTWFDCLDYGDLHQLGVRIVEGGHPGSSYYAAELRGSGATAARRRARPGTVGDGNSAAWGNETRQAAIVREAVSTSAKD